MLCRLHALVQGAMGNEYFHTYPHHSKKKVLKLYESLIKGTVFTTICVTYLIFQSRWYKFKHQNNVKLSYNCWMWTLWSYIPNHIWDDVKWKSFPSHHEPEMKKTIKNYSNDVYRKFPFASLQHIVTLVYFSPNFKYFHHGNDKDVDTKRRSKKRCRKLFFNNFPKLRKITWCCKKVGKLRQIHYLCFFYLLLRHWGMLMGFFFVNNNYFEEKNCCFFLWRSFNKFFISVDIKFSDIYRYLGCSLIFDQKRVFNQKSFI